MGHHHHHHWVWHLVHGVTGAHLHVGGGVWVGGEGVTILTLTAPCATHHAGSAFCRFPGGFMRAVHPAEFGAKFLGAWI